MQAAAGGALGMLVAMRYGIARGIYANEAGYGTAAVAYGTAQSAQPVQQGLNAVIEVFTVSFVTSTISAMTILLTGAWQSGLTSSAAVAAGFNTVMPTIGGWIVAFCVFLFGYTTLIGWAYYGEQFFEYILGRNVTVPYRWIYCLLIPFGAVTQGRRRVGLGRPDERVAGLPEPDRPDRPERPRRQDCPRSPEAASNSGPGLTPFPRVSPLDRRSRLLLGSLPQFPRAQWVADLPAPRSRHSGLRHAVAHPSSGRRRQGPLAPGGGRAPLALSRARGLRQRPDCHHHPASPGGSAVLRGLSRRDRRAADEARSPRGASSSSTPIRRPRSRTSWPDATS